MRMAMCMSLRVTLGFPKRKTTKYNNNIEFENLMTMTLHPRLSVVPTVGDYVRVDLYEVKDKIIFGELTFYPARGLPDFTKTETDLEWGRLIDLSNYHEK